MHVEQHDQERVTELRDVSHEISRRECGTTVSHTTLIAGLGRRRESVLKESITYFISCSFIILSILKGSAV